MSRSVPRCLIWMGCEVRTWSPSFQVCQPAHQSPVIFSRCSVSPASSSRLICRRVGDGLGGGERGLSFALLVAADLTPVEVDRGGKVGLRHAEGESA